MIHIGLNGKKGEFFSYLNFIISDLLTGLDQKINFHAGLHLVECIAIRHKKPPNYTRQWRQECPTCHAVGITYSR